MTSGGESGKGSGGQLQAAEDEIRTAVTAEKAINPEVREVAKTVQRFLENP